MTFTFDQASGPSKWYTELEAAAEAKILQSATNAASVYHGNISFFVILVTVYLTFRRSNVHQKKEERKKIEKQE